MPASLGGDAIFGLAVSMQTGSPERETQTNGFFGLDGVETLDGGKRGRETRVEGLMAGVSPGGLSDAEDAFRSKQDGQTYTLVDTLGKGWPDVRVGSFNPVGRVRCSMYGVYFRPYKATLIHNS